MTPRVSFSVTTATLLAGGEENRTHIPASICDVLPLDDTPTLKWNLVSSPTEQIVSYVCLLCQALCILLIWQG